MEKMEIEWRFLVTQIDPTWILFTPQGNVPKSRWFVWQPVEGAVRYELELVGPNGSTILIRPDLEKNRLSIPSDIQRQLSPGSDYRWIATAYDETRTVITRGVGRFTLRE